MVFQAFTRGFDVVDGDGNVAISFAFVFVPIAGFVAVVFFGAVVVGEF